MALPQEGAEFFQRLNRARQECHLSVRALARATDVSASTAQGWLNGRHVPTAALRSNYLALVELLGLSDELPVDCCAVDVGVEGEGDTHAEDEDDAGPRRPYPSAPVAPC